MIKTFSQSKCPHCGHIIEGWHNTKTDENTKFLVGCPLYKCPNCQKPFSIGAKDLECFNPKEQIEILAESLAKKGIIKKGLFGFSKDVLKDIEEKAKEGKLYIDETKLIESIERTNSDYYCLQLEALGFKIHKININNFYIGNMPLKEYLSNKERNKNSKTDTSFSEDYYG